MYSKITVNYTALNYNASSINVLSGLTAVRKRPGMYIGDTEDNSGLYHIIFETLDNSIDETLAGFCSKIRLTIHQDHSISVEDNGRGIPIDLHKIGLHACEIIMCTLHAGGKFDNSIYKISGGLHGVGISVVNALSNLVQLDIQRKDTYFRQWFSKGFVKSSLIKVKKNIVVSGTYLRFWPDKEIFSSIEMSSYYLLKHLKEQAFLNKKLVVHFLDTLKKKNNIFFFPDGILSLIYEINRKYLCINKQVIYFKEYSKNNSCTIELAMQWNNSYKEHIQSFTNNIYNYHGGTHQSGFKAAVTRSLNTYINTLFPKTQVSINGDDVREGIVAILSIKCPNPKFNSQIKEKLVSSEIKGIVDCVVYENINNWLYKNPIDARKISQKILNAAKTRETIRKTKELSRKKSVLGHIFLPGKLADCQVQNYSKSELFIVEGESAGGSAKSGRNRFFQAILPLKGKILNVEKCGLDKILSNQEIVSIITVLGTGIGVDEFNITKLRYNKIIIMTDADVDGSHIKTLLLTFFYRQMKPIVHDGYLHIAQPPLYKINVQKQTMYFNDIQNVKMVIINMFFNQHDIVKQINIVITQKIKININKVFTYADKMEHWQKRYNPFVLGTLIKYYIFNKILICIKTQLLVRNTYKLLKAHIFLIKVLYIYTFYVRKRGICIRVSFIFFFISLNRINLTYIKSIINTYNHICHLNYTSFKIIEYKKCVSIFKNLKNLVEFIQYNLQNAFNIQRYKGLGEMNPRQLWDTTMNPKKRKLLRINVNNINKTNKAFSKLMGDIVDSRKHFVETNDLYLTKFNI